MLELVGVCKRFGPTVALDDVSLRAESGRILGFLGPNGAGKTTAMRVILGVTKPDTGHVLWNGREIGEDERRRIGYLPEERGLYPYMQVREQLVFLARLYGLTKDDAGAAVDHWMERLGVAEKARMPLTALSHGNQQRVQLVAALAPGPAALVLDEPFSGLDPVAITELVALLRECALTGLCIVFSSHQLDVVEDVCDDLAIINGGRIRLSGSVPDLRRRAGNRYLRLEVEQADYEWLSRLEDVLNVSYDTTSVRLELGPEARPDLILKRAMDAGEVLQFAYEVPTIADLFREAVHR